MIVVAAQVNALEARQRLVEQQVDHVAAVQTAVDVIAHIDGDVMGAGRLARAVLDNVAVQPAQQVDTAVDIANRIDADAGRNLGGIDRKARPTGKPPFHHVARHTHLPSQEEPAAGAPAAVRA